MLHVTLTHNTSFYLVVNHPTGYIYMKCGIGVGPAFFDRKTATKGCELIRFAGRVLSHSPRHNLRRRRLRDLGYNTPSLPALAWGVQSEFNSAILRTEGSAITVETVTIEIRVLSLSPSRSALRLPCDIGGDQCSNRRKGLRLAASDVKPNARAPAMGCRPLRR